MGKTRGNELARVKQLVSSISCVVVPNVPSDAGELVKSKLKKSRSYS